MRTYLGLFILAGIFGLFLTLVVRSLGRRGHAYGQPRDGQERAPVPRLGGIAIFLAALAAWGVLLLIPNAVRAQFVSEWRTLATLLVPGTLVLLVGVYDDLVGATAWQKLIAETLAAGMVWWAGVRIVNLPLFGSDIHSAALSLALTVFWIIAVTNSLNLIDGLDGLAAGIAFFVTICVFVVSLIQRNNFACVLAITLAGALLGFLRFNFAPATIFLGDAGSLFLGFFLACLAIHASQKSSTLLALVVPFVAFGLPLLDTALTVLRRLLSGRPLFAGDRDHIHHRLLKSKLTPRVAVLGLYGLAALFSLGSLLIIQSIGNLIALAAVLTGASAWFLTSRIRYEELSELNVYVSRAVHSQRRVLVNEIVIRKASRELETCPNIEKSWQALVEAMEALDFDEVACQLHGSPNGQALSLPAWSRPGVNGDSWSVSIPLRDDGKALGELQLRRALSKDRLLFQFSSLLDTLVPPFEKQLKRCYDVEQTKAAGVESVLPSPALQFPLVANGGKG